MQEHVNLSFRTCSKFEYALRSGVPWSIMSSH